MTDSSDDMLPELLHSMAADGRVDSAGSFTLAPDKVARRYAAFVDQEPAYPVLALLQLGWQLGGRNFEIRQKVDRLVVDIPLKAVEPAFLDSLENVVRGFLSPTYAALGRAVWSSISLQPRRMELSVNDGQQCHQLLLHEGAFTKTSQPANANVGLHWEMEVPASWLKWARWMVSHRFRWNESLARRVALFPGALVVDADDWTYMGDPAITGPWSAGQDGPQAPALLAAARLCDREDHFALFPPYCYHPARVAWKGGPVLTMGPNFSGPTYFLEGPLPTSGFVHEEKADVLATGRVPHFSHPDQLCLLKAQANLSSPLVHAHFQRASAVTLPPRRCNVAKQAFMTVPMRCDLALWRCFNVVKSRIHFISHGLLLNPLESQDLPPGLEVVALLPRGENYLDFSGWNVTEKVPLVPLLKKIRQLLERARAALLLTQE